jgi:hypothetical protein
MVGAIIEVFSANRVRNFDNYLRKRWKALRMSVRDRPKKKFSAVRYLSNCTYDW